LGLRVDSLPLSCTQVRILLGTGRGEGVKRLCNHHSATGQMQRCDGFSSEPKSECWSSGLHKLTTTYPTKCPEPARGTAAVAASDGAAAAIWVVIVEVMALRDVVVCGGLGFAGPARGTVAAAASKGAAAADGDASTGSVYVVEGQAGLTNPTPPWTTKPRGPSSSSPAQQPQRRRRHRRRRRRPRCLGRDR